MYKVYTLNIIKPIGEKYLKFNAYLAGILFLYFRLIAGIGSISRGFDQSCLSS